MKKLLLVLFAGLMFSCSNEFENINPVNNNVERVFGTAFNINQDWISAETGSVTLTNLNASKVQILSCIDGKLKILNESNYYDGVTLNYDFPKNCDLFVMTDNQNLSLLNNNFDLTRASNNLVSIPEETPEITGELVSYAVQRGYEGFSKEKLYTTNISSIEIPDYSASFKKILRAVIFTYLPNGRGYNNLNKIKESGYYNEDCYAITTGKDPIVVSPIYKNDGGYGEVETCDLYYYYFKGNPSLEEIKSLPKYKAFPISENILADDSLGKHHSYVLAYFGDSVGTYKFPEGMKIGFMVRSNFKNDVKKGELYFDGRLNKDINKHGHFASSKLGDSDPRMCWITANKKVFFSAEAGTDTDFNDIIFEVEGGVEPIDVPIIPEYNDYIYLFEDREIGDYDMNDVVIRGIRLDATHVKYEILATGAKDELYIKGINGNIINESKEIHSYFGVSQNTFVNVNKKGSQTVSEIFEVDSKFSFLNNLISVFNKTTGKEIKIAQKGQDPHAIMVPFDFKWPKEKVCIKDAYYKFNEWGQNPVVSTDWYLYYHNDKVTQ